MSSSLAAYNISKGCLTAICLSLIVVLGLPLRGQTGRLVFEVASVRKNVSNSLIYRGVPIGPGRTYIATNLPLHMLLLKVYDVREEQLLKVPSWVNTDRFDISARSDRDASAGEMKRMIQALLEDRFHLSLVRTTRQQDVYVLTRLRNDMVGPNLHPRTAEECQPMIERKLAGLPNLGLPKPVGGLKSSIGAVCEPFSEYAAGLGRQLHTDVIDKTGLTGLWDAVLAYSEPV